METPPAQGAAVVPDMAQPASQQQQQPESPAVLPPSESATKDLPMKRESLVGPEGTPGTNGVSQPQLNGHSSISNGVASTLKHSDVQEPTLSADLLSPVDQPSNHKTTGVESETAALHLNSSDVNGNGKEYTKPLEASHVDTNMDLPDDGHDPLFSSTFSQDQDIDHDMGITPLIPVGAPGDIPLEQEGRPEPASVNEPAEKGKPDQVMGDDVPAPIGSVGTAKVPREREDDDDERAAKRKKTEDLAADEQSSRAPEVSSSSPTAPAAPVTPTADASNGLPDVLRPITKLQTKYLIRTLQSLKRLNDAQMFKTPVDPIKLNIPSYPTLIKHPMDMQTIEGKLKSEIYNTPQEVIGDFQLMVNNSKTFNGPEHPVSKSGDNLFRNFERHILKLPGHDEVELTPAEKKSKKAATAPTKTQPSRREARPVAPPPPPPPPAAAIPAPRASTAASPTFALGPEGLPLIRRDSTTVDGRPKRSIHPPKNRDLPFAMKPKKKKFQWELKFCQEVLDELHKGKHYALVAPFYFPVDPVALNIPTYHHVIKKPMDLQTMKTKLSTGQYENAKEFEVDMRQIFKNCYKFNIFGDPVYTAGKRVEELFDNKWSQKARWLEAHEPSSGHQSAGSSDESDDHDEEDSDDNEQEKLTLLQKQIAEMSKQVEAITKKKKTPPASKKLGKAKGKKDAKRGTTGTAGRKDKKGGGSKAKSEKTRWITYQEKTMISNGISSLPENKMSEALTLIQRNVPSLQGTNEAEIELDIDELPNDVLLLLLKFVRKHAPAAALDGYNEPSDPEPIPSLPQSKPKKSKPMNKTEQEEQIRSLQSNLSKFKGGAGAGAGGTAMGGGQSYDQAHLSESSGDDEDSEESEEE
ncbi:bromodomain containing protein [Arthroderma uncinatum]|uniref:bromodomain containing protein n=1 Tax=Arthroderma uncinatum TaxID=74035 RepID=UPI00144A62A7|nr:bromodomain containing protein [Arthroderma uncinatum]KAF3481314.1 bromodomain containing protein [Arthroderma uncinatum]